MRLNPRMTIVLKVLYSILGIGTALIFFLNGVISAFGFDAVTSVEFVTGAKGLYVINTLIGLLLLGVVSSASLTAAGRFKSRPCYWCYLLSPVTQLTRLARALAVWPLSRWSSRCGQVTPALNQRLATSYGVGWGLPINAFFLSPCGSRHRYPYTSKQCFQSASPAQRCSATISPDLTHDASDSGKNRLTILPSC